MLELGMQERNEWKFDVWNESIRENLIFGTKNLLFGTAIEIERDVALEDEKEFVLRTWRMEVWCSRQKNGRQFGIRDKRRKERIWCLGCEKEKFVDILNETERERILCLRPEKEEKRCW